MPTLLEELKDVLEKNGLMGEKNSLNESYEKAIKIPRVLEILDLELPPITDLSKILGLESDSVMAIRMDLNKNVKNHKKFVVAGLILRGVLLGFIPSKKRDTLIDGGNFNSASALKFYAKRFGMKGMYIMSYLFPDHIINLLEGEDFTVIRVSHQPKYDKAREREFYEFLYQKMRETEFGRNKFCLWHAKHGGEVGYPFGKELAKKVPASINCIVSCLGAGSTLEGIQIPIQDYFKESNLQAPKIFVAEHELSPLFTKIIDKMEISRSMIPPLADKDKENYIVSELPHLVIGPHYDEINPLLSKKSIERIEGVIQYSETDWQATQAHLFKNGVSVGNSSAANISVAWRLANQGFKVITIIFEPKRSFLLKQKVQVL